MNLKNYKCILCTAAAVVLLGAAVFCGFKIYSHYQQIDEQTEAFAEIAEVVENAEPEEEPPKDKDTPVSEGEDILAKYKELYLQNEDMVGWIAIDGTGINYPVMQSKNNPNFYLKHSFEKEYSDLGVPYIQEDCDILTSDNLVIYGHHIKGGRMFGHWKIINPRTFMRSIRPFSLTPSRSRRSMKSLPCLRPWRTAHRATATMILSMRRMKKNLMPLSGSARSLPCMIRA